MPANPNAPLVLGLPDPAELPAGMKDLAQALVKLREYQALQNETRGAVRSITARRQRAIQDDTMTAAKALAEGTDAPPSKAEQADRDIAHAERQARAADHLVEEQAVRVRSLIQAHRAKHTAALEAELASVRGSIAEALAILQEAVERHTALWAVGAFLERAQATGALRYVAADSRPVPDLVDRAGQAYSAAEVVAALYALVDTSEAEPSRSFATEAAKEAGVTWAPRGPAIAGGQVVATPHGSFLPPRS